MGATEQFDVVNEWLNVEQSIILPFALLPLLFFSCNRRIMGDSFILSIKMQIFYGIIGAIIVFINVYLVILFITEWDTGDDITMFGLKWFILSIFLWIYLGCVCWLLYDFIIQRGWKKNKYHQLYDDGKVNVDANKIQDEEDESKPLLAAIHNGE